MGFFENVYISLNSVSFFHKTKLLAYYFALEYRGNSDQEPSAKGTDLSPRVLLHLKTSIAYNILELN